jgi:hypothetical protein
MGKDMCREVAGIDSGFPSRQWVGADKCPGKVTCFMDQSSFKIECSLVL